MLSSQSPGLVRRGSRPTGNRTLSDDRGATDPRPPGPCALPARPCHRSVPFLHDHVIGDVSPQTHGDDRGNNLVRYHGYFVLCSAQGISTGGCVPTMTSIPGLGTVPFATTVNGHKLTSADPIESPANARLLTLFDTGGEFIATIKPRQEDESR